jgi:hypothetical protein
MNPIKIHDIKSIVEVTDYSYYFFLLLLTILSISILYFIFYIYKKIKNRKKNYKKTYIQKLKEVNFSQSKITAYKITKYIQLISKNELQTSIADELIQNLNQYKYKKDLIVFDDKSKELYKKFMDSL